jgi:hypothetical protein
MLVVLFPGTAAALDLDIEVDHSGEGLGDTDAMLVPGGSRLEALLRSTNGNQPPTATKSECHVPSRSTHSAVAWRRRYPVYQVHTSDPAP